ncbi:hypothetical protein HAQ01_05015 [Acidithiobacillus thiooxidans]|uniref:hypothetical protein n=1 Tax=Acidithiobacillus thiooxidans TaxID=930 RepID=UPI001C07D61F|nr:hypothetical protein [Acidithiobacillus thiooxidans]MBU2792754.1 hypothetical protein [Acidithiobacillus thiooxidans]
MNEQSVTESRDVPTSLLTEDVGQKEAQNKMQGITDQEFGDSNDNHEDHREAHKATSIASAVASAVPSSSMESGYDVPSRRLSLFVEGRDYLKYRETFERLLFSEKMPPAKKDARILELAMACLTEKMDAVSAVTGEPFVKAEMLAG